MFPTSVLKEPQASERPLRAVNEPKAVRTATTRPCEKTRPSTFAEKVAHEKRDGQLLT